MVNLEERALALKLAKVSNQAVTDSGIVLSAVLPMSFCDVRKAAILCHAVSFLVSCKTLCDLDGLNLHNECLAFMEQAKTLMNEGEAALAAKKRTNP